jgi:hypothetical protein
MKFCGFEATPQELLALLGGLTGLFRRKVPHELQLLKECRKTFTRNQPLTTFCYFSQYRELAKNLSKTAAYFLLWTMEGSPIHENRGDIPTESDKCFAQIKLNSPDRKIRVVVFQGTGQKDQYLEATGEALSRKKRFEESAQQNNGKLYFTTRDKLPTRFKNLPKGVLDIGFVMSNDDPGQGIALESGFDTAEQRKNHANGNAKHITIFRPPILSSLSEVLREDDFENISYRSIWGDLECYQEFIQKIYGDLPSILKNRTFVTPDELSILKEEYRSA